MIIYFNLFTNCSSSRPTEFQLGLTNELQFLTIDTLWKLSCRYRTGRQSVQLDDKGEPDDKGGQRDNKWGGLSHAV